MLQMGVLPQVASATIATMIVLTSSSVALIPVAGGLVPWDYALILIIVAFTGAVIGKSKIDNIVKQRGLSSILIFILAGTIFFASVMATIAGLIKYADQGWCFEGVNAVCEK